MLIEKMISTKKTAGLILFFILTFSFIFCGYSNSPRQSDAITRKCLQC
jgi:hypothetical protein